MGVLARSGILQIRGQSSGSRPGAEMTEDALHAVLVLTTKPSGTQAHDDAGVWHR